LRTLLEGYDKSPHCQVLELFSKVVKPDSEEIYHNPRARSAKLRIAIKLASGTNRNKFMEIKFPKVNLSMRIE